MTELRRDLTLVHGIAIVVGITIGTGVFLKSAPMAQAVGSPLPVMAAWVVAGFVAMLGALCFAELGTLLPRAGGEYLYIRAAFGDLPGFLYVCMSFIIGAASLAAYGAAFSIFLSDIVTLPSPWFERTLNIFGQPVLWQFGLRQSIGIAVITIFTGVNLAGVAFGGRVQTFLTSLKVIALVGLIAGVFLFTGGGGDTAAAGSALVNMAPAPAFTMSAFGFAMLSALWAYSGWQYLPMAAAEVRDPARNVPRAVIGGGLLIVALYLSVNAAYFHALPFDAVVTSNSTVHPDAPAVGARAAESFLGPNALAIAAIIFLISTVGSLNGVLLTRARVPYAAARDGLFFQRFARLSPGASVPAASVLMHGVLAALFAASGTFDQLTNLATLIFVLFWALSGIALLVLRRKLADAPRPFRVPAFPLVPLAFILIMAGVLVSTIIESPAEAGAAFALLALGLPLYPLFHGRAQRAGVAQSDGGQRP
ncbi:MAG: Amino acid transporter [Steroidobacteraceae bacterium]|nr:Amino acid transporter [Steroidobacteraceae bacterium]